jgi:hypothetical protein
MAPQAEYLMDRNAEIALARSAAPSSISHDAEVLVLGSQGYELAVKGTNGFVCVVERGWAANAEDPDFWNPKLRGPVCFNPPAARSYWPIMVERTQLVLAGKSKEQMFASMQSSFVLPTLEVGSMCYMLSRDGYLGDGAGHWHPHLMFFLPQSTSLGWGAGLPGSPVFAGQDPPDRLTVFMVPVRQWSDGTPDHQEDH